MDDLVSVERDTPERRAEFLLSNAVDAADYARAVEAVRQIHGEGRSEEWRERGIYWRPVRGPRVMTRAVRRQRS